MITKEQAEQTFYERYAQPTSLTAPEIRNVELQEIASVGIDSWGIDATEIAGFDLQEKAWKVTFEIRYRQLVRPFLLEKWTGEYHAWRAQTCYIIEAAPGPYVLD